MAMLGALHNISIGLAPHQLPALALSLGIVRKPFMARSRRGWMPLNKRQLETPVTPLSSDVMNRSLFGPCRCCNCPPQALVDLGSVKLFQLPSTNWIAQVRSVIIFSLENLAFYHLRGSTLSLLEYRFGRPC